MEIAVLALLIVINGIFAMTEIALVSAKKSRLQKLVEAGDRSAKRALELGEHPTKFLSTIQIGITSIGVLNGIVGEAALAKPLAIWMQSQGIELELSQKLATGFVVIVITYFSIVFGELVPKRLGQFSPEPIARLVARPMLVLATLSKPFVHLLTLSTEVILKLMGVSHSQSQSVTEEDIEALLAEGSDAGVIEQGEHDMVRNVFRLDDRQINSLMIPRSNIVYIDVQDSQDDNWVKLQVAEHSRFPVCDGGLQRVLGIANTKEMLAQILRGEGADYTKHLQPVIYVPETLTGMELLNNFRQNNMQFALVLDEYGEVKGLVTLQDVLEAITGEFKPHKEEDGWSMQREDGSWLLDGLIPIPELKDLLQINELPEDDKSRYHTLSGMLMLLLARVPMTGDVVEWGQYRYEVVDMDNKRIDKVLVSRLPQVDTQADPVED